MNHIICHTERIQIWKKTYDPVNINKVGLDAKKLKNKAHY